MSPGHHRLSETEESTDAARSATAASSTTGSTGHIATLRIHVFPNDLGFDSHFKHGAVRPGANQRVAVGQTLPPEISIAKKSDFFAHYNSKPLFPARTPNRVAACSDPANRPATRFIDRMNMCHPAGRLRC